MSATESAIVYYLVGSLDPEVYSSRVDDGVTIGAILCECQPKLPALPI